MKEQENEELPEWYSMAQEFFQEISAYSTPMYEDMGGQVILQQIKYAAEREQRTLTLRKKIYSIFEIAKEHQKRYNEITEQEYWKGRRDEAGWLADELLKIIEVR